VLTCLSTQDFMGSGRETFMVAMAAPPAEE